ncbi:uncharacterized protein LOC130549723 [Triplophysa rosa]|uniref:uncharacterized protein LOC130549723 n=1 Tax=Triplophysa rosa TaxID=992332 RepID=UPI0025460963|nr:uncharacterized protein LOC130549723 [Triplophysa rosa]
MEGPEFYPQIILPRGFCKNVMHYMHDGPVGGHFGVERMLSRLQTRYYWYKMREDVTLWCRTCTSCAAKARPTKRPQALMGTVRVGAPMERIAADLMGPMNETERFSRYILVVQALGQSVERAKRQYNKTVARRQYKIRDAVWYLIKGTKRVKNKIRKFLPSYEGPYFFLGHLDDLVYRIQKSPKAKVKVVHHDKLKPYHARQPLDNSWVLKDSESWQPLEVSPPSLEDDPSNVDISLNSLFSQEIVDSVTRDKTPTLDIISDVSVPEPEDVELSGGSTVPQELTGTVYGQKGERPLRTKRQPKWYGEWTS